MVALAYDDVAGRVRFQLILCSACSAPVLVYYNQLLLLRTEHAKPVKPLKLQVSRYASWMVVSGVLSVLLVLFRGPFGNDSRTVVGLDYEAWIVAAPVMSTVSTLASSLFSFSIKKGILTDRRAHRTLFFFCSVVCLVVCMTAGSLFNYCVYEYTDFSDLEDGGRTHTDRWVAIVMSFTWTVYNFFSITHMISNVARHVGKVAPEKTEWINFKSIEYYSPRLILIEEAALSMVDCLSIALPSVASTVPVLRSGRAN
jgi:magnesium-transporting ATPase (P-type)